MKRKASFIILSIIFVTATASAYIVPENRGGYTWKRYSQTITARDRGSISTWIYVPDAAGPHPFMVFRHGYGRTKDSLAEYGQHFASRGFIVLLNDSRSGLSTNYADKDSNDLIDCANSIVSQNTVKKSFLRRKVDTAAAIIAGFSAGGYAAEIATYKNMVVGDGNFECRAMMLFDPAPGVNIDYAVSIAAQINCPAVVIDTRGCDLTDQGVAQNDVIFPNLGGDRLGLYVNGADHCDAEGHYSSLCASICGGGCAETHNKIFRRYGTAFLESYIKCIPEAYTYINEFDPQDTSIIVYPETRVTIPPDTCP